MQAALDSYGNPSSAHWAGGPARLIVEDARRQVAHLLGLRERFGARVVLNGHPTLRLPNTLNVSFLGAVGNELLARFPQIAASTGSACHAGSIELSPVLQAMGITPENGVGAVRFSLGLMTTRAHVESALAQLSALQM